MAACLADTSSDSTPRRTCEHDSENLLDDPPSLWPASMDVSHWHQLAGLSQIQTATLLAHRLPRRGQYSARIVVDYERTPAAYPGQSLSAGGAMNTIVETYTAEIKALVGRTAQNIVEIGEKLQAVKAQLEHGLWEEWLRKEFDWGLTSAWNMMRVAARFKSSKIEDLRFDVSALYVLAAPSTPP